MERLGGEHQGETALIRKVAVAPGLPGAFAAGTRRRDLGEKTRAKHAPTKG